MGALSITALKRGLLQFLPRDAIIGTVALEPVPANLLWRQQILYFPVLAASLHDDDNTASMYCQTCDDLLASYKFSARVYINAMKRLRGLVGEEYRQTLQKAEQLRLESEGVNEALMEHWRQGCDMPEEKRVSVVRLRVESVFCEYDTCAESAKFLVRAAGTTRAFCESHFKPVRIANSDIPLSQDE